MVEAVYFGRGVERLCQNGRISPVRSVATLDAGRLVLALGILLLPERALGAAAQQPALGPCRGQPLLGPLGGQVTLDLGEQPEQGDHHLGLQVLPPLEADDFFDGDEANLPPHQRIDASTIWITWPKLRPRRDSSLTTRRPPSCSVPSNSSTRHWAGLLRVEISILYSSSG